jgi:hypothetical protein
MNPAHNPDVCRCDNCILEREMDLIANFWTKAGQQSPPARSRWWIVIDLAVLILTASIVWVMLFGS